MAKDHQVFGITRDWNTTALDLGARYKIKYKEQRRDDRERLETFQSQIG